MADLATFARAREQRVSSPSTLRMGRLGVRLGLRAAAAEIGVSPARLSKAERGVDGARLNPEELARAERLYRGCFAASNGGTNE